MTNNRSLSSADHRVARKRLAGATRTLNDVAKLAGVHSSTVSRVLRGDSQHVVSSDTRRRILGAAEALRYSPNAFARGLRTRRTNTIALLIPYLDNLGFSEITRGIQAAAAAEGYLVLLAVVESLADESQYTQLVRQGRADGILAAFGRVDDPLLARLAREEIPLVLVNRRVKGVSASVTVNDEGAARAAVDHLVSLGHRRIAHIAGAQGTDTAQRREQGYRAGLSAAGLRAIDALIVHGGYSEAGGAAAANALLGLSRSRRPTGIVAADLMSGLGAMGALHSAGVEIPADMSVVALNDHVVATHSWPPLTSVRMPYREMGVAATEMLIRIIDGREVRPILIDDPPPAIVCRQSTGPPSA